MVWYIYISKCWKGIQDFGEKFGNKEIKCEEFIVKVILRSAFRF